MVTRSAVGDRGQVLLITAITLSFILIGLAVLLNAGITTEVRSPDDPSTDIGESQRIADDLDQGLAGLVAHVNARGPYDDRTAVNDTVAANVSTFGDFWFEALGERRATLLDLDYGDVTDYGTYVADGDRAADFRLRNESDVHHSVRIDDDAPARVYGLLVSVDTSTLAADERNATGIQVWGATGCHLYSLVENGTDGVDVRNQSVDCEGNETAIDVAPDTSLVATCNGTFATVDFGRSDPGNESVCHVDAFGSLRAIGDGAYGLSIRNPAASDGGYHFLTNATTFEGVTDLTADPEFYHNASDPGDDYPRISPVAWTVSIDVEQRARASIRDVSRAVDVYATADNARAQEVPW